jgi:hypothetical protein
MEEAKIKDIDVPWVCERDIDLLILEEFVASPDFLAWFLGQIGIGLPFMLISAACNVSSPTRESDLEIIIQRGGYVVKPLLYGNSHISYLMRNMKRANRHNTI